jgi:hypothetical protein
VADVHKIPKVDFNMNLDEIDKIVFEDTMIKKSPAKKALVNNLTKKTPVSEYQDKDKKADKSIYEEEESYENPINISKAPGYVDQYEDIKSEACNSGTSSFIKTDYHEGSTIEEALKFIQLNSKSKSKDRKMKKEDMSSFLHNDSKEDTIKKLSKDELKTMESARQIRSTRDELKPEKKNPAAGGTLEISIESEGRNSSQKNTQKMKEFSFY